MIMKSIRKKNIRNKNRGSRTFFADFNKIQAAFREAKPINQYLFFIWLGWFLHFKNKNWETTKHFLLKLASFKWIQLVKIAIKDYYLWPHQDFCVMRRQTIAKAYRKTMCNTVFFYCGLIIIVCIEWIIKGTDKRKNI